jgi:site-specific recombinase XerD
MRFEAPDVASIAAERDIYLAADLSPLTVSSYAADVRVFEAWCFAAQRIALPADEETVELYLTALLKLGRKVTTIERHCSAIRRHHLLAEMPNPARDRVKRILSNARRILGQAPAQKTALEPRQVRQMIRRIGGKTAIRARNSALLSFGFCSTLRRSTLAGLRPEDLQFVTEGVLVTVRHEKQDRRGKTRKVAVPFGKRASTCPVRLMRRWLKFRGNCPGALFCHVMRGRPNGKQLLGNRIGQIVQESAALIGLDRKLYGAHSLRAGFATEALGNGAAEIMVARQTGHASLDTLRLYERSHNLFRANANAHVSL